MNECLCECGDDAIELHFIMLDISLVSWAVRLYVHNIIKYWQISQV